MDRWRGGSHIQRVGGGGIIRVGAKVSQLKRFRYLKLLRMKLQEEAGKRQRKQGLGSPMSDDLAAGYILITPEN